LLTAEEMAYVLTDSRATVLVCHSSQMATGARAAALAGIPVVSVGPASAEPGWPPRLEGVPGQPLPTFVTRSAQDPAVIFFTSGTTGKPKGAVLSHLNLVMNAMVGVFDAHRAVPEDVVLGCLPLFHTFGQTVGMNGTFRVGGTLVLLARFTGRAAIDLMVAERVNVFHGVPTMYVGLLEAGGPHPGPPRRRPWLSGTPR